MDQRAIPYSIRRAIWDMPCAVCGVRQFIEVDHIIPVTLGGTRERSNLQPLCWQCNCKKSNRLTNEDLLAWVRSRGDEHYLRHEWKLATRYETPFDRPGFRQWLSCRKAGAPRV